MSLLDSIAYNLRFELRHLLLRRPKVRSRPARTDRATDAVQSALEREGIPVTPLRVDVGDYLQYLQQADYPSFTSYYANGQPAFAEKSLEHYLAARLLALAPGHVYIDIASDTSPTPEIYRRLFGVTPYRQDLAYPDGVDGNRIGGDAAAMPITDEFVDSMALHCSFEHFEGDSDQRFITECARVLRPGGRVCILPLYLTMPYGVMTDPGALGWGERPPFEPDATVYSSRGWGNRHGRFYDAAHLKERVLARLDGLRATIYRVMNAEEIDPTCYLRFAMVLEKPSG